MINYWWVTRPKRKLNTIPELLATVSEVTLNEVWSGDRNKHLELERSLEAEGLKRTGDRRDQTGGGARTYLALLKSLGLLFEDKNSHRIFTTLAGDAIISGENSYEVISNQVLKYQFPSYFSQSRGVDVNSRFKIHPFIFLLRLLRNDSIGELSTEEIGKIVITQADNESVRCFDSVVNKILAFRRDGDESLASDFEITYAPSKGGREDDKYGHLLDVANTIVNWLEFTRLISRDKHNIFIPSEKIDEVDRILSKTWKFIPRPDDEAFFQRQYGLAPGQKKDTRNLTASATVTASMVEEARIRRVFISESLKRPIASIDSELIDRIAEITSCDPHRIEDVLNSMCPGGTTEILDTFLTNYRQMAFLGRDEATDFEKATKEIMERVFGYKAKHVGPLGLTPDVLVFSDSDGYLGIFDNKAYARYSISNDHRNRMITNYIGDISRYNEASSYPLSYFSYIAGGFKSTINAQIEDISRTTSVFGSAITVDNFIKLIKNQSSNPKTHDELKRIFSVGREIHTSDILV